MITVWMPGMWGEERVQDNPKAPCQGNLILIKEGRRKCVGVGRW